MSPTIYSGLLRQWFPQCSKLFSPLLFKPLFPLIPVNGPEAVNIPLLSLRPFLGQPPIAISCISLHESFLQKLSVWAWQARNMSVTHPERSPQASADRVQEIMVRGMFLALPYYFPKGLNIGVQCHLQLTQEHALY